MPTKETDLKAIWLEILTKVQESLSKVACEKWLLPVRPIRLDERTLELAAPNDFSKDWIKDRYIPILEDAVADVLGTPRSVELISLDLPAPSDEDQPEETRTPRKVQKAAKAARSQRSSHRAAKGESIEQTTLLGDEGADAAPDATALSLPKDEWQEEAAAGEANGRGSHKYPSPIAPGDASTLNPKYTFDTFVTGKSNQLAHAASISVAENPGHGYNPLFLYGGVGLGKTHLMHAIGHRILKNHPEMRVLYVSSEKFTNELINSIRDGHPEKFRDKYRTIDVLMVDDIQFLSGKTSTQEEFFHTFNALHDDNKQIILSSDRPPKEVEKLEERLRSRFEWGLITDIQAPDLETRIAILRKKAMVDNIEVPNDVMFAIANRIDTNIRELEGALTRVCAYASLTKQPVTTNVVSEALKDLFPTSSSKEITLEIIQEIVAAYFKLQVEDLHAKKRSRSIAFPRQIAMYLCRELTESSLPAIGQFFGGRDHTTVLHAYDKIKKEKETDEKLNQTINELIARIQKM